MAEFCQTINIRGVQTANSLHACRGDVQVNQQQNCNKLERAAGVYVPALPAVPSLSYFIPLEGFEMWNCSSGSALRMH